MADLKTALENACVANGWTLTSGILSRSTSYFQLTAETAQLTLRGGTGQTGATLDGEPLIGAVKSGVRIINYLGTTWTYPVNYEIHNFIDTDEIYFIVNYNSDFYQQLSFGKSNVPGIGGSGAWFTGQYSTQLSNTNSGNTLSLYTSYDQIGALNSGMGVGLFFDNSSSYPASFINAGLDTTEWKFYKGGVTTSDLRNPSWAAGLLTSLPSLSNSANVLVPVKAIQNRSSNGQTIIANLKNARYLRIDYINPGDIITFGAERWKVYPMFRKDASARNGIYNGSATHSGTFGYAIKYTGP